MDKQQNMSAYRKEYIQYLGAFSVILTVTVFMFTLVELSLLSGTSLMIMLLACGAFLLVVQLRYFLHVRRDKIAKTAFWSLIYTFAMAAVIIGCSLWIMINMNYNMHYSPEQMQEFMLKQNKKGF